MYRNSLNIYEHDLSTRLKEVPVIVYQELIPFIIDKTGVCRATFYKVVAGRSANIDVLFGIADYFKTTLENVINPNYFFEDPRPERQSGFNLAEELGLVKVKK